MRFPLLVISLFVPAVASASNAKGSEGGSMAFAVLQMLASLAVVIGVIYLLYYLSTRWFGGFAAMKGRTGRIKIIETRYLAPKRSLMIVKVAGEYLLLGSGNEGVQLLKKLECGEGLETEREASPATPSPELFRQKLDDFLGKMRSRVADMKHSDFSIKERWTPGDEAPHLTVEQLLQQLESGNGGSLERR